MQKTHSEVLIIGAGAAGLAAAYQLSQNNISVIVLEARERVGGRIFTSRTPNSTRHFELGAEFIHGRPPELIDIVEKAKLKIEEVSSHHWFLERGKLIRSGEFWSKVEKLMDGMKLDQPDMSFQQYLDSLPNDDETRTAKEMAGRYIEGFHAAHLDRIGVHGLIKANAAADEIGGDRSFRVVDGYDKVLGWLREQAETRNAVIRFSTPAIEIRWKRGLLEAVTSHGETFTASAVILTVPVSLLASNKNQAIRFVPQLPSRTIDAIQTIAVGDVVRIELQFKSRFWNDLQKDDADLSELGFIHCSETSLQTWWTLFPDPGAVLVGWSGGPRATALPSDKELLLREALGSLSTIFGVDYETLRELLVDYYVHDWRHDELTREGYSYIPVNGLEAQVALAEPITDTIFFAGEATSVGHIGTVHGAIASGYRAANQILELRR